MAKRGMTLIECLIVLALVALVAAISLPLAREARSAFQLRLTAELLVSELAGIRAWAVSHNSPVSVRIAETGEAYGFAVPGRAPDRWTGLPPGIHFIRRPRHPLTFHSRGNVAPAGSLVLQSTAGEVRVVVAPMGRVRWEWITRE